MPEELPEERRLRLYLDDYRELRLTGWTERDESYVKGPYLISPGLDTYWWQLWVQPGAMPDYGDQWQMMALMTFSLRRSLGDDVRALRNWWNYFRRPYPGTPADRDGSAFGYKIEEYYTYYDGDRRYSHAIYLDPTGVIGETPNILRLDGTKSSQGLSADLTVEVTKPRQIPLFPQWDDKIIKRFYRSDDPEMRSYTKAVDDWSALMNNAISQLA